MAKIIAAADLGVVYDSNQVTLVQGQGAIYDAAKKKWDFSKMNWK